MTVLLSRIVLPGRLVAVHAPLGEVEGPGTVDHIRATLPTGVPLILAPVASGKKRERAPRYGDAGQLGQRDAGRRQGVSDAPFEIVNRL